ncbi:hypothetical protein LCGC14_2086360 [marine sediment metagenome]|uniref:Uncharacterized protein n=1 Tax=marine sediment metagenome TaxID=412755 RepID=A0A0F9EE03_9ZZZZ
MDMEKFKLLMDIVASLAALVAIVTILISWYQNSRNAIKIKKVVIYGKHADTIYNLVVENRKDYPVEIKSTICYTKKVYNIEKKPNEKPVFSVQLKGSDIMFRNTEHHIIGPKGNTNIEMVGICSKDKINKLLFCIETSHGSYQIWCRNLFFEKFGKCDVYDLEYRHEYESWLLAKARYYYWGKVYAIYKELTKNFHI